VVEQRVFGHQLEYLLLVYRETSVLQVLHDFPVTAAYRLPGKQLSASETTSVLLMKTVSPVPVLAVMEDGFLPHVSGNMPGRL
jgi:hypothetical protein